jgi:hypothetical protein
MGCGKRIFPEFELVESRENRRGGGLARHAKSSACLQGLRKQPETECAEDAVHLGEAKTKRSAVIEFCNQE